MEKWHHSDEREGGLKVPAKGEDAEPQGGNSWQLSLCLPAPHMKSLLLTGDKDMDHGCL